MWVFFAYYSVFNEQIITAIKKKVGELWLPCNKTGLNRNSVKKHSIHWLSSIDLSTYQTTVSAFHKADQNHELSGDSVMKGRIAQDEGVCYFQSTSATFYIVHAKYTNKREKNMCGNVCICAFNSEEWWGRHGHWLKSNSTLNYVGTKTTAVLSSVN